MPSSHSLFRRFENKLCGTIKRKKKKLEWCAQDGNIFFRPIEKDVHFLWAALDILGRRSSQEVWNDAVASKLLRRALFLRGGESIFVGEQDAIIHPDGTDYGAKFLLADKLKAPLFAPQQQLEQLLVAQDKDPLSELNAARKWLVEEFPQGKSEWKLRDKNGHSDEEVMTVLEAFVFAFELPPEESFTLHVARNRKNVSLGVDYENRTNCKSAIKFLNQVFSLEIEQRRYVRGYSGWMPGWIVGLKTLGFDSPSQHERLEALMVWRDFLHGKLPSEEIEALLPKL